MSTSHTLRSFETVDHAYERVVQHLRHDALGVFRRATRNNAELIEQGGVQLHAHLGSVEIGADVTVDVGKPEQTLSSPVGYPITAFPLTWRARDREHMFPEMRAKLLAYPHSSTRTQLEIEGTYDPPLGVVGDVLDALGGHRIAESSVARFLREVSVQLSVELHEADSEPSQRASSSR